MIIRLYAAFLCCDCCCYLLCHIHIDSALFVCNRSLAKKHCCVFTDDKHLQTHKKNETKKSYIKENDVVVVVVVVVFDVFIYLFWLLFVDAYLTLLEKENLIFIPSKQQTLI